MPTIPACAGDCWFVAMLLAEVARLTGTSVDVQRVGHGLDPLDD